MMNAIVECMTILDTARARMLWHELLPHLPPIETDEDMLAMLHLARTRAAFLADSLRFYSHCWLAERKLPSMLPDAMRPAAERMYPRVCSSVGISVNGNSELFKPVVGAVRAAMEYAVIEAYADGKADDIPLIKQRMADARRTTVRKLLGIKDG